MTRHNKIHFLLILFFLSVVLSPISAQRLWLRADAGITTNASDKVSKWESQTSNGHQGTQSTNSARPVLIHGGINFNPTIRFDGTNDYIPLDAGQFSKNIDNLTIFSIIRTDFSDISDNGDNWAILDYDRSHFFSFAVSDRVYLAINTTYQQNIKDIVGNQIVNDGIPHIVTGTYDNSIVDDVKLFVDGGLDKTRDAFDLGIQLGRDQNRFGMIGDGSESTTFDSGGNNIFYEGEIAEIIFYRNNILTPRKTYEINSYLALKYGITQAQPNSYQLTGNVLAWDKDQTYASTFKHNIAGVFRDDAYSLDQRISRSVNPDAMLTIALDNDFTAPNLDHTTRTTALTNDVSGLVWGHNGTSKNRYKVVTFNNNTYTYKKRIWYAADTNFNSNVHLMFSDESIVDGATYYLITESDGDGDFSNDGVVNPTSVVASNNAVVFSNVNVSNKYFTIADKIPNNYMRHGKFFRDGIEQETSTSK